MTIKNRILLGATAFQRGTVDVKKTAQELSESRKKHRVATATASVIGSAGFYGVWKYMENNKALPAFLEKAGNAIYTNIRNIAIKAKPIIDKVKPTLKEAFSDMANTIKNATPAQKGLFIGVFGISSFASTLIFRAIKQHSAFKAGQIIQKHIDKANSED